MSETAPALRFVVLRHDGIDHPHFDLLLEPLPGAPLLLTWRTDRWPIDRPTPLTRLADHRNAYLVYEGPVSGGRGFVRRVAEGTCEIDALGITIRGFTLVTGDTRAPLRLDSQEHDTCIAVPVQG